MSGFRGGDGAAFSLSADGKRLAVGDGPELLVYRQDGQPVWKAFCEGVLVGVDFAGEHLGTVDADGRVVFFRAADGLRIEEVAIGRPALSSFASPDGLFGVVTDRGPALVAANGQRQDFPVQDLACAAFGPDRGSLGLGTHTGTFISMDGNTGAPWGTLELGGPVLSVAWCTQGFWLAVVGRVLFRIDGAGAQILGRVELDGEADLVVCTSDGAIAALRIPGEADTARRGADGPDPRVAIHELYQHTHAGDVLFRRPIAGLQFGRAALLGIGLDDGDASTVDLITRATLRTEPHPGRGRNNWNLDMKFDAAPLRGAVTFLRAGGQSIANYHGPPVDEEPVSSARRTGCMIAFTLGVLALVAVSGCLTLAFVLRYVGYI